MGLSGHGTICRRLAGDKFLWCTGDNNFCHQVQLHTNRNKLFPAIICDTLVLIRSFVAIIPGNNSEFVAWKQPGGKLSPIAIVRNCRQVLIRCRLCVACACVCQCHVFVCTLRCGMSFSILCASVPVSLCFNLYMYFKCVRPTYTRYCGDFEILLHTNCKHTQKTNTGTWRDYLHADTNRQTARRKNGKQNMRREKKDEISTKNKKEEHIKEGMDKKKENWKKERMERQKKIIISS